MAVRLIPIHSTPWHLIGFYDNIFVISFAAFAFIAFKNMSFMNRFVNMFAKSAFAIYLVHPIFFTEINTKEILTLPLWKSLLIICAFILFISIIAWILFNLYNLLFEKLVSKLDKYDINYFDKQQ